MCARHSACYCHSTRRTEFERAQESAAAYRADADRLRDVVLAAQDSLCGGGTLRTRVLLPGYGLGGSILDHLRRLMIVWQGTILRLPFGNENVQHISAQAVVAVPRYDAFAANQGNASAFLLSLIHI